MSTHEPSVTKLPPRSARRSADGTFRCETEAAHDLERAAACVGADPGWGFARPGRCDYALRDERSHIPQFAGYLSPGGALQLAITGHPRAGARTDDARQARRSLVLGQFVVEEADDVGGGAAGFAHVGHGDGPDVEEARAPL